MKTVEEAAKEYVNKKFDKDGVLIDGLFPSLKALFKEGADFRQPEIDKLKQQLEKATKWVSVDEELPEKNVPILLKDKKGFIKEIGFRIGELFFVFNRNSSGGYHEIYFTKITHWRPIYFE